MNLSVRHLEIKGSDYNEIKLYELQVKITCTILELIDIMLSQNDINIYSDRVVMINYLITALKKTRVSSCF